MSNHYEKILTRIAKLLDLAKNAGTDQEAANAASRARLLMEQYEIEEAELRLVEGNDRRREGIVEQIYEPTAKRKRAVTWEDTITDAVARSLNVRMFWHGAKVFLYGRESAVQATAYTAQYLQREVQTLADSGWSALSPDEREWLNARSWKNSFRVGCASAIARRLVEAKSEERRTRREAAEAVGKVRADAMAVVERDHAEVDESFAQRSKSFGKKRMGNGGSSSMGFSDGAKAGRSVHLGGGRGALGKGHARIGR